MTAYRRNFIPGGTFFFTVNLQDRRSSLLTDHIDKLRDAFRLVRDRHPFAIDAIVVLPEHLHAIWTLPPGDRNYSTRWRLIKSEFARGLPAGEVVSASRDQRGERGIWQRRFWEHTLRDDRDVQTHVDYIHINPVKHRYVGKTQDWPFSSFAAMVRQGVYPEDWGGDVADGVGFGER